MIKAIIFDAGGVIVDHTDLFNQFMKTFKPKNPSKFWETINIKAIPLCRGQENETECSKAIAKAIGMNPDKAPRNPWTENYEKLTKIDKKMLNLIKKLRKKYKTALISNTIKAHSDINKKRGLYNVFDKVVLSYKTQTTKDNKKIFRLAIKKLNAKPKECIFIDDIKRFTDIAKSIGMQTILFKNVNQLKKELMNMGININ